MTERLRVETHSHTRYSKDCLMHLEEIIAVCRSRGIDRLAVTDHNTAEGALAMQQIAPDFVIVGEEIMTTEGELLGYYMTETIPRGLTPEETIKRLRDQGAVISVSHPFDRWRRGAWKKHNLERIIGTVDAIEVFNARCSTVAENNLARDFAAEHEVLGTVGSDAHTRVEYGTATLLMQPFDDAESFRESLQTAERDTKLSSFLVHFGSSYAKYMKRFGFKNAPSW